ncbi:MAG TPA: tetratricopeptide repeat protein [Pyrinomonadaceae bacterium]|nr:tetratricopeptide repeat protein [Pyrinomonadaceae bacterium]
MKSDCKRAAPVWLMLACLCASALFVAAPTAHAQPAASASPSPSATPELSPRQRRAQAYAKLLEGQRHYAESRNGSLTFDSLRKAQAAFREAAELDPTLSEAHTALAEIAFFFLDDLTEAEREATAATRADRNNFGAHRILARVYTVKSNFTEENLDKTFTERAIAELREVLRLRPRDAEAWALLSEFYLATERQAEALDALKRWADAAPPAEGRFYEVVSKGRTLTPDAAQARLGEVLLQSGRIKEAVTAIRQAVALEPDNPRYVELLAQAFEASAGTESDILSELRRMVETNPRNLAAVSALARSQESAGRIDEASATLRAAIDARGATERERFILQAQLARTLADALRYQEAVAVYEDLLKARRIGDAPPTRERDRDFASLILRSIIVLQRQTGRFEQAAATLARMRAILGDSDSTVDAEQVALLRQQGKLSEALETARNARTRRPDDPTLLRLETEALADLGRVEEAVRLRRARLKGTAEDFGEYAAITLLLMGVGRGAEAVESARQGLELVRRDSPALTNQALMLLASAQERAGDPKGSEESLRRVLADEPNNATALNNLGYFLAERNERLEEALSMVQRALRTRPNNPSFLDSLGWIYFKLGKLDSAEHYLSEAARRDPTSSAIQEHRGDLLHRRGKSAEARAAWQKALTFSVDAAETERLKAKLNGKSK